MSAVPPAPASVGAVPAEVTARATALAGPGAALLALLCLEAAERCRASGAGRVLFLTREGLLFQQFFERFAAAAGWSTATALFHASRLSTFAASLIDEQVEGLTRFFSQYGDAGWEQLLRSLGAWPMGPDSPGPRPERGAALLDAFRVDAALRDWLARHVRARHAALAAYVARHHATIGPGASAVLVDIGWRGTIQDNLAAAFPACRFEGIYFGLFPYHNAQRDNCGKHGLLFEEGRTAAGWVGGDVLAIEYLFHADAGSIVGYSGGEPVWGEPERGRREFAAAFQQALLEQAGPLGQRWAAAADGGLALRAAWRDQAQGFWRACQHYDDVLFAAISRYRHDEEFGLGRVVEIASALSWRGFLRALVSRADRALFIQHSLAVPEALRRGPGIAWWLRLWYGFVHVVRRVRRWRGAATGE